MSVQRETATDTGYPVQVKRTHRTRSLAPVTTRPKSAAHGVGAQAHVRYCPTCGQKRRACRCGGGPA